MLDYQKIIEQYYKEGTDLYRILLIHSRGVAEKALAIAKAHPELGADEELVYAGGMLHDIGIFLCDAPGIKCEGTEPYIRHGILGAELLRRDAHLWGLSAEEIEPYARFCERHTGAGLSAMDIRLQGLPLPEQDFMPETVEEQLVCYADKFFSKTRPEQEKTFEQTMHSMFKFGHDTVERFKTMHEKLTLSV